MFCTILSRLSVLSLLSLMIFQRSPKAPDSQSGVFGLSFKGTIAHTGNCSLTILVDYFQPYL